MAKVFCQEHSNTLFSLHFCEKTLPPKWSLVRQLIKTACRPMNVFSIISITDNHTKVPARIWPSSKMVLVTTSLQPEQIHFKFWADLKLIYKNRDWLKYNNIIITSLSPDPCSRLMTIAFCERAGKNSHLI